MDANLEAGVGIFRTWNPWEEGCSDAPAFVFEWYSFFFFSADVSDRSRSSD